MTNIFVSDRFQSMKNCRGSYYVVVVEDCDRKQIVASATLHIEQKFIHQCRPVIFFCFRYQRLCLSDNTRKSFFLFWRNPQRGRIEDVVVDDNYRKRNIGKMLVSVLYILKKGK